MNNPLFKHTLSLILFGINGIVASRISLSSYEIVFFRLIVGSLFLLLVFLISGSKFSFLQHKRQLAFVLISGTAMAASWLFLYEAFQQVGVGIATLAYSCGPVIVMLLSPLLFHEKLSIWKITGFLVVLLGVFLVNVPALQGGKSSWGLFCAAMSAVTYALMVIFNKKAENITGTENACLQLIISLLIVAAFISLKQGFAIRVGVGDWFWIFILGVLNTGIGCYLYFSTISYLPVQTVAICSYLEPFSAVIFSVLILKEILSPIQILGAALILGGAVFAERQKSKITAKVINY